MILNIYPWQNNVWKQLSSAQGNPPHALLFYGQKGIGKYHFAMTLAYSWLCPTPDTTGFACGQCTDCHFLSLGGHPNLCLLEPANDSLVRKGGWTDNEDEPKKKSRQILIEQIRELDDFVNLTTHHGVHRIVLIHPAEELNRNAANALLKTLEDPSEHVIFFLVSHRLACVLPTVRSRCRMVAMPVPPVSMAVDWLQTQKIQDPEYRLAAAGGAPFTVMNENDVWQEREAFLTQLTQPLLLNPIRLARFTDRGGASTRIGWLQRWVYDLTCLALRCGATRYHLEHEAVLRRLAQHVNLSRLLDMGKNLTAVQGYLQQPLNPQLLLEEILFSYTSLFTK